MARPPGAGDSATGADFNPVVDRLRVVNFNQENFRINPNNGALSGDDTDLTFTAPATGPVTAVAYDRNIAPGPPGTVAPPGTLTTLYGIDVGSDRLVVQGGVNGAARAGRTAAPSQPSARLAWWWTTRATRASTSRRAAPRTPRCGRRSHRTSTRSTWERAPRP